MLFLFVDASNNQGRQNKQSELINQKHAHGYNYKIDFNGSIKPSMRLKKEMLMYVWIFQNYPLNCL